MASTAWKDIYILDAYLYAKQGLKESRIAEAIGVSYITFCKWKNTNKAFKEALGRGKSETGDGGETFFEYVFKTLPDELKVYWKRLCQYHKEPNTLKRVQALMEDAGKQVRQHLFLHSLAVTHYNLNEACRKVGIPLTTYHHWVNTDSNFGAMVEMMEQAKKNFFESALHRKVYEGDTKAIIFANSTKNKDRGYGKELSVNHSGQINHAHAHAVLDLDKLDLPLDVRRQVLIAYEKKRAEGQAIELEESEDLVSNGSR